MNFTALTPTTTNKYKCVTCASENINILRADAENPRLKCGQCGFVFNGADSLAAEAAGEISGSSPDSLAAAEEPEREEIRLGDTVDKPRRVLKQDPSPMSTGRIHPIPRQPTYVFLTKDRSLSQFATKRTVKAVALEWEAVGRKYDVFELAAKKFEVQVDIQ